MTFFEQFLTRYEREYDFYLEAARLAAQRLEKALDDNGIRGIVTFRAKRHDRLKTKLEKRYADKDCESVEQLYSEIVDLAGVRVALYFPGDYAEVDEIIRNEFEIQSFKTFPEPGRTASPVYEQAGYSKRFMGYSATHYRVRLKQLAPGEHRYANATVEIQLASVLMHAWAEVEHDLVYKPFSGQLSQEEYAVLDELNGLVLTGEITLGNLQRAGKARLNTKGQGFNNHFELASYLSTALQPSKKDDNTASQDKDQDTSDATGFGRVGVLFRFLQLVGRNKPESIKETIKDLPTYRFATYEIAERVIGTSLAQYKTYMGARHEVEGRDPYGPEPADKQAVDYFLSRWIALELAVRRIAPSNVMFSRLRSVAALRDLGVDLQRLSNVFVFKRRAIFGLTPFTREDMITHGDYLDSALALLREKAAEPIKTAIEQASAGLLPRPDGIPTAEGAQPVNKDE